MQQQNYPFLVLVPSVVADETTMGEWLELREIDYMSRGHSGRDTTAFEFHFSSKEAADEFARNFIA
jgi:hypothetical protein